jgi:hypothetical protein
VEQVFKADLRGSWLVFDAKGLMGIGICTIVTVIFFLWMLSCLVGVSTRVLKGFCRALFALRFIDSLLKEALLWWEGVRSEVLFFIMLNILSRDGFRWGHSSGGFRSFALEGVGKIAVKG